MLKSIQSFDEISGQMMSFSGETAKDLGCKILGRNIIGEFSIGDVSYY